MNDIDYELNKSSLRFFLGEEGMSKSWGEFLDRLIYEANSSHSELSKHLKVSPQYIYSIIKGESRPPKIKRLKQIFEFLNTKNEISRHDKTAFFYLAMIENVKDDDLDLIFYVLFRLKT